MIKNIIFDMGGVILDLDFSLTSRAFHQLGAFNFDSVFCQNSQDRLFDEYETGKITSDIFRSRLCEKLGIAVDDDVFDSAWNAMLLDLPKDRLDFIATLRKNFNVILFSNTNAIHLQEVFNLCQKQYGFSDFSAYFDKEYYSFRFGKRKPDPESFLSILHENSIHADETLFVDDSLLNILGARQAALHAFHLTHEKSIFDTASFLGISNSLDKA